MKPNVSFRRNEFMLSIIPEMRLNLRCFFEYLIIEYLRASIVYFSFILIVDLSKKHVDMAIQLIATAEKLYSQFVVYIL